MIKKISLITFLILSYTYSQSDTLLIFSEVMFNAPTGANEFIEVYNLSNTESVDLSSYQIKYYTASADQIMDAGFGTTLPLNRKLTSELLEFDDLIISNRGSAGIPPRVNWGKYLLSIHCFDWTLAL